MARTGQTEQATAHGLRRIGNWLEGRRASAQRLVRRVSRRTALALTLVVLLLSGVLVELGPAGLGAGPAAHAQAKGDHPTNRFDPHADTTSVPPRRPTAKPGNQPPHAPVRITRPIGGAMETGMLVLHPDQSSTFVGSDGRLEVDVPAGAVTAADMAAAGGGGFQLRIAQVSPASGATSGGGNIISFGTYLLQVVDAHGALVPVGTGAGVGQAF
jgi:hypothetical protein